MKIEITQKGVFDSKGTELKLGSVVEISADKMPAYLVGKARVLEAATPTETPAKAK